MLLVSAGAGAFLLATDRSLWLLAVSHAMGLVIVVALDVVLGVMSLGLSRKAYLPSIAAAVLAAVLQVGDIATAPQYNQSVWNFASYLFGLWAFDLLLGMQVGIIVLGVVGRRHASFLARLKSRRGRELSYSRRGFLKLVAGFAGLVGVGVAISSVKIPVPSKASSSTTSQSGAPADAIANINTLEVGTPVYFYFPSGYPNVLIKNPDNSLSAVSVLCTHICCECQYVPSANLIECPCHGSVFQTDGTVVRGPAQASLPQVELKVDKDGYITPTAVSKSGPCQV